MGNELQDQKSRDRIRNELDRGFAVEAAAGTGKTTEMVARIVNLILAGARPAQLAAITFTEKAAAELELRVRTQLEGLLARGCDREDKPLSDEARARLQAALPQLDSAPIATIHAFALSLVMERPVEAGVGPGVEIMDELYSALSFLASWERWLRGLAAESRAFLLRLARLGFPLADIEELARHLAENRDLVEMLERRPGRTETFDLGGPARKLCGDAEDLFRACEPELIKEAGSGMDAVRAWLEAAHDLAAIAAIADHDRLYEAVMRLDPRVIKYTAGRKECWTKGFNDRRKERMKESRDELERLQAELRAFLLDRLLALLAGFVAEDWAARAEAGRVNFQDVLILARDLLRDPEARADFSRRFRCLLVDEFQDTDPLQVEIVTLLFGDRPEGLFLVGDPKQSIYRFRRADIGIYGRTMAELSRAPGRERESLRSNFRSVPGIVAWINRAFAVIIQGREGLQAEYVPMVAARSEPKGARLLPPVSALRPPPGALADLKIDAVRLAEARAIAGLIRLLRDGGYQVPSPRNGETMPLEWRHIAVLYGKRPGEAEAWVEPFLAYDIPVVTDIGSSGRSREEARALRLALMAVNDPSDALALFGALRSPLFGLGDEELLRQKFARGALDYRHPSGDGSADLEAALALFRRLHREKDRRPPIDTVEEILRASGLAASTLLAGRAEDALAAIEAFRAQVRELARTGADFGQLINYLAALADLELEPADPPALDPEDDFVRLSTVHSAKGLEFPVVILANLGSGFHRRFPAVLADRLAGTAEVMVGDFRTPGWDQAKAEEEQQRLEESRRLLYVAATRAREALIFSLFCKDDAEDKEGADDRESVKTGAGKKPMEPGRPLDLLPASLRSGDDPAVHYWDFSSLPKPAPRQAGSAAPPEPEEADPLRSFRERRARTLDAAGREVKVAIATAGKKAAEPAAAKPAAAPAPRLAYGSDEAVKLGALVHEIMETIDLRLAAPPPGLVAARARAAGIEAQAPEAERLVANILASPPLRRAGSASVQREVPYSLRVGDEIHEGKIDLLFRAGARVVVVDYKTDRIPPAAVPARLSLYRSQGEAYRRAVRQSTGADEVEVWFVFAGPGEAVELK